MPTNDSTPTLSPAPRRSRRFMSFWTLRQQRLARPLTPVLAYLRRDYAKKPTLRQAAELANMSESQFRKAFERVAGLGFVADRTHWRVSNAIRLLHDPERTDPTRPTRRKNHPRQMPKRSRQVLCLPVSYK